MHEPLPGTRRSAGGEWLYQGPGVCSSVERMGRIPRKNVLFILADQFRADCLGAAGNPIIRTPNLDALAAEGVLFEKCFCQTNPCGPSRMCIFTSRYLCSTRALTNETPLVDAEENLAMHLQAGGYNPGLIGYNDYVQDPRILPHGHPQKTVPCYDNVLPGFDWVLFHDEDASREYIEWLRAKEYPEEILDCRRIQAPNVPPAGPGEHLALHYPARYRAEDSEASFVTETAIRYIDLRRNRGWALSLNYIKPHPPRICPAPYHEMYNPAQMPPASRRREELGDPHPYFRLMHAEPRLECERDLRETQANYHGMITELDDCLGRLFDYLKRSGQWENTLIVFSADHGEMLGDHYLLDKAHFYDGTMRVPLILRDPSPEADSARGARFDRFAETIDIAPTILEFLDLQVPDRFQGRSLLGQVRNDPEACVRREIHFEFDFRNLVPPENDWDPNECLLWVIRDDRYKYVQFGLESLPPLLFDLQEDPSEFNNLAKSPAHAAAVAECAQRMLRWRMRNEDQRMEHWAARHRRP
ncbi:MAG: Multifunctional alkaline phosphatase superfamily protein [bacterium]|nr:Multifunctional alkaline phosphatase superfamily protein [bacterium]